MRRYILLVIFLFNINLVGQSQSKETAPIPRVPFFVLDNKAVTKDILKKYKEEDIAAVAILKDSDAVRITKDKRKDLVIIVTTKVYARAHFLDYLKSKSMDFVKVFSSSPNGKDIVYILNDKTLDDNHENMLYFVDDRNFIDLKVIDKGHLKSDFNIIDKKWGIVVRTKSKLELVKPVPASRLSPP